MSFHIYAQCGNNTGPGLEPIFPSTDDKVAGIMAMQAAATELRPEGLELHLTESGILCNQPHDTCDGDNDYPCWYRTFDPVYWTASAGQWVYQFLTYAQAVNLTSVAQSQILGYVL